MQKGNHVIHKKTGRAGRIESLSGNIINVTWNSTETTTAHEASELDMNLCNTEHSMYKGLFCILKPKHEGWCGCN